VNVLKKNLC